MVNKKKIREKLTARAEESKKIAKLALRVAKILQVLGYTHKRDIWKNFDTLLLYEIRTTEIRHEVLKRVFSARGGRISLDDETWIEKIESKVGIS
jgi:hypothetical protein